MKKNKKKKKKKNKRNRDRRLQLLALEGMPEFQALAPFWKRYIRANSPSIFADEG